MFGCTIATHIYVITLLICLFVYAVRVTVTTYGKVYAYIKTVCNSLNILRTYVVIYKQNVHIATYC